MIMYESDIFLSLLAFVCRILENAITTHLESASESHQNVWNPSIINSLTDHQDWNHPPFRLMPDRFEERTWSVAMHGHVWFKPPR